MKILIIIDSLNFGGAEIQAITDANLLVQYGNLITIIYAKEGPLEASLHGHVVKYKLDTHNQFFASFQLLRYLLVNRFDIIHSHMFWAEKVSALPAFITGHRLLFNEHGLGKWRKWYHSLLMRFITVFANKVACSCDLNCEIRIEKREVPKKKLVTLYNSFNCTIDEGAIKNKSNTKTIGFVGRFNPVKQLDHFITLAEALLNSSIDNFNIILVGDGELKQNLEKQVFNKQLSKYFTFTGFQHDTSESYNKMSIFVLPSRIEGLSVALIEAQAYGIPAIAFDVGGNKEIILDSRTGFTIEPKNIQELFEKVKLLLINDEVWRTMSNNAFQNAHNRFSNTNRINSLYRLYNSIAK